MRLPTSALAAFVLLFTPACARTIVAAERPNIVVFVSDDLGRLETSVHGSKEVRTPNLGALAKAGMTFESAYVASPSCCPNRFSLLTGLMPARHGAHPNHSQPKRGTKYLLPVLQSLGYKIASFGKVAHGRHAMRGVDFNSFPPTGMSTRVEKWLAEPREKGPICLLVGDRRPHVSWIQESIYDPNDLTLPPYFIDTPETREHWARYLTEITGMDEELGRVLALARKEFGDDFVTVFTSDHGGQWPRGKWNLYDAGTRVPLIVAWPGHVKPGTRTDAMVSWVDILPTLIDLAGGDVPKNIDGRSFAPVLLGENETHRDAIFTTHTGDGPMNVFPMRSVRVGDFKYIHNLTPHAYHTNHSDRHRKDGAGAYWDSWDAAAKTDRRAAAIVKAYYTRPEFELFNLETDPLELHNLAADPKHTDRLKSLRSRLAEWTTSQGDDLKPHREPYPVTEPLPHLPAAKPKRRP